MRCPKTEKITESKNINIQSQEPNQLYVTFIIE